MMNKTYRFLLLSALIAVICFATPQASSARSSQDILISTEVGNSWDWLTGARPLFLLPGQTSWTNIVHVRNNPFNISPFSGQVQLHVTCCLDMMTRAPVSPVGLSLRVIPSPGCYFIPTGPDSAMILFCPITLHPEIPIDVTPNAGGTAYLIATTTSDVMPGDYIATLVVDSPRGQDTQEIFLSVLPGRWPGNGPTPACKPMLTAIPLASLDPLTWKGQNPNKTTFSVGVSFVSSPAQGGLEFTVSNPSPNTPMPRNTAVVTFKNTKGWPVAMETVDSRNCSAPTQMVIVREGMTGTLTIDSSMVTTLVFSKSTCRAWINLFDCWGESLLGMDEIVTFSEGPFWALFGGRKVDIATVTDWGAIPSPDSIAVIHTP